MRTEAKIALLVVLVVVVAAAIYFFSPGSGEAIDLTPTPTAQPPAGDDVFAPLAPKARPAAAKPKPVVKMTPRANRTDRLGPIKVLPKSAKPAVKVDLGSPTTKPASRPSIMATDNRSGVTAVIEAPKPVIKPRPNQPASIRVDVAGTPRGVTPATPIAPKSKETIYIVRSGDTLYDIAERQYGRGELYPLILKANPSLGDGSKLRVGQKLSVPNRADAIRKEQQAKLPTGLDPAAVRAYKVQKNDSFYTIAKDQLGAPNRWKEIYELNKKIVGGDPSRLKVGQTIYLPRK